LLFYFLLVKLVPGTIRSKKKVGFNKFIPLFMYRWIQDPVLFYPRIRDEKLRDRVPGSGIKHPGSAALATGYRYQLVRLLILSS
jgi:hypothetical protein